MSGINYKNNSCVENHSQSHSQVKRSPYGASFLENLKVVKEQTEYDTVLHEDRPNFTELCINIAEVVSLPDDFIICIEEQNYPITIVKEIYSMLRREHLELVIDNFKKISYRVNHKKTYFRTSLYNSVLELNGNYDNAVRADGVIKPENGFKIGGGYKK